MVQSTVNNNPCNLWWLYDRLGHVTDFEASIPCPIQRFALRSTVTLCFLYCTQCIEGNCTRKRPPKIKSRTGTVLWYEKMTCMKKWTICITSFSLLVPESCRGTVIIASSLATAWTRNKARTRPFPKNWASGYHEQSVSVERYKLQYYCTPLVGFRRELPGCSGDKEVTRARMKGAWWKYPPHS